MTFKMTSLALALVTVSAFSSAAAFAQAAPQTKRGNETLKKYCTGDYLTYCGNLSPDDPAVDKCFQTNWTKLSENCRRAIDAYEKTGGKKG